MMKILINAGHGGSDSGAIGGIVERDFNYSFAQKIVDAVNSKGGDAVLISSEGGVAQATKRANAFGADCLLLSIHANCCGGTGFETFFPEGFYKGKTKELVDSIHASYGVSGLRDRGIKSDKVTRFGRLGILQDTKMPSTLLECGFVDVDAPTLADHGFQNRMADVLAMTMMSLAGQHVAPAPTPIEVNVLDEGAYLIVSKQNGKALDCSLDGGICAYKVHGGSNQIWNFVNGSFMNRANGKMIDIAGASPDNGAKAIVWSQHGGGNQKFKVNAEGQILTFCGKVLDIAGGSDLDGTPVIQWSISGGSNQMWHFIKVI